MARSFQGADGTVYRVGDSVLVKPEGGGNDFIAEIKEIKTKEKDGDYKLQVVWFYRPEEIIGGRKMFHGQREVCRSDHADEIESSAIRRKCRILTLEDYQALPRPVKDDTFFSCCFYHAKGQRFKPDRMPTFCLCKMPFNPDLPMVQCDFCKDFFHRHCMQLSGQLTGTGAAETFDCKQCKAGWQDNAA